MILQDFSPIWDWLRSQLSRSSSLTTLSRQKSLTAFLKGTQRFSIKNQVATIEKPFQIASHETTTTVALWHDLSCFSAIFESLILISGICTLASAENTPSGFLRSAHCAATYGCHSSAVQRLWRWLRLLLQSLTHVYQDTVGVKKVIQLSKSGTLLVAFVQHWYNELQTMIHHDSTFRHTGLKPLEGLAATLCHGTELLYIMWHAPPQDLS